MQTRIIASADVSSILSEVGADALMNEIIDGLVNFCHAPVAQTDVRSRGGFHYDEPRTGLLEWMPVHRRGDSTTVKMVGYHPRNPETFNVPTIIGSIGRYDARTGALLALADGTLSTAMRTGAASAVASLALARTDSRVLGIIGCGAQAVTQCHALMLRFPIDTVLAWDTASANSATLAARIGGKVAPVTVRIVEPAEILEQADILCTCTSVEIGEGPVFDVPAAHQPHLHINAVGSDFPGKTELPAALLAGATVVPDHPEQCILEGECQQLRASEIGPDLRSLVRSGSDEGDLRDRLTVFDSTGWAAEDQVVMDILIAHAERLDLGQTLLLHSSPPDPLNPY